MLCCSFLPLAPRLGRLQGSFGGTPKSTQLNSCAHHTESIFLRTFPHFSTILSSRPCPSTVPTDQQSQAGVGDGMHRINTYFFSGPVASQVNTQLSNPMVQKTPLDTNHSHGPVAYQLAALARLVGTTYDCVGMRFLPSTPAPVPCHSQVQLL